MSDFDYSIYTKKGDEAKAFIKSDAKLRTPMPRSQRAKQFAPFDALTGLHARLYREIEEHKEEAESGSLVYIDEMNE